jgi:hypothetical protein
MIETPVKCVSTIDFDYDSIDYDNLLFYFDYHNVKLYKEPYFKDLVHDSLKKIFTGKKITLLNVRLHSMEPGVKLHKHADPAPPDKEHYHVFHIPLKTNKDSWIAFEENNVESFFHLKKGYLWELNNTYTHWGANEGKTPRLHLFIETYIHDEIL